MNRPITPSERLDIRSVLGKGSADLPAIAWRSRTVWVIAASALVLLAFLPWYVGSRSASVRYVTEPVSQGGLTVVVTATGSVQPTKKVDISSELSGTVRTVLVDYNSTVTAGQLLAELDTDKLKATVDSATAKLATARARVAEADATVVEKEKDLARKKTLAARRVASPHDLDVAQAAHDRALASTASARAEVEAAAAELHLSTTNLAKSRILSPIGGVVLKRNVEPGQTVASTLQAPVLFSIAEDLKQMEVQVDVDEADVGKVRIGQQASFGVDAFPDRKFPASIRDVRYASETIQGVVTYKAVLSIDNSELLLRPGMTATAEIRVTEIANAMLVPNASLRFRPAAAAPADNRSFLQRLMPGPPRFRPAAAPRDGDNKNQSVWLLRNGQPFEIKVRVGVTDGRRTEVVSGELRGGELAIVDRAAAGS